VAATSVSEYVAEIRGSSVGGEVGYQVRFEDETSLGTRANFMTDGILLGRLQHDPLLMDFDVVMVDEAHERGLNTDFVLGLLKRAQRKRQERNLNPLKIIVASATLEKEKFAEYFGVDDPVEVEGRMFPVDVRYEKEQTRNVFRTAAEKVRKIIDEDGPGDILIFMPGKSEIEKTIDEIQGLGLPDLDILPLYGGMKPEDQRPVFRKSSRRKVIVATNIAETSVTIDGVAFVVDSGLIKQKRFSPRTGLDSLDAEPHAQSGCNQRMGRAGRTAPGVCYRLYTEEDFRRRDEYQTPEIVRSSIDSVVLAMKRIDIDDVRSFDFVDPPSPEAFDQAIEKLKALGALDEQEKLTETGRLMAELPLSPEIGRMVAEAEKYGCVGKICTIAALASCDRSVFFRPEGKFDEADSAQAEFRQSGSDFMSLLEVWNGWEASGSNIGWARRKFFDHRQLDEARKIRNQILGRLKRHGIQADDRNGKDPETIQKCVVSGLVQRLAVSSGRKGSYRFVAGPRSSFYTHPSSVAFKSQPDLLIGDGVMETRKVYARRCQPVKPEWLFEVAPQLIELDATRRSYDEQRGVVIRTESFRLKGNYVTVATKEQVETDPALANRELVDALLSGKKVDLPFVGANRELVQQLALLEIRSCGRVKPPQLADWYREKTRGAVKFDDLRLIQELLTLRFEDYCPPETMAEIERLFPESITVKGHELKVTYRHEYGYEASVMIPEDLLFEFERSDFPTIGDENGTTKMTFQVKHKYSSYCYADIEELKVKMDQELAKDAWNNFNAPPSPQVALSPGEPLPSLESLGAKPIEYFRSHSGEPFYAYPYHATYNKYDSELGQYVYVFGVKYSDDVKTAQSLDDQAVEIRTTENHKFLLEQERRELAEPARKRHEEMRVDMESFCKYGSDEHWIKPDSTIHRGIKAIWSRIGSLLSDNSSFDPSGAIKLMDQIEVKLDEARKEKESRESLMPEARARMDELSVRFEAITRSMAMQYGLTDGEFASLNDDWKVACALATGVSSSGRSATPDPQTALEKFRQIEARLSGLREVTPEQRKLTEAMSGRDSHYAQILRVQGGRLTESFPPGSSDRREHNPTVISVGGSGRHLAVSGNRVTFVYASGNTEGTWLLGDGDYLVGRDADTFLEVEEDPTASYGWKALGSVERDFSQPVFSGTGDDYYEPETSRPVQSDGGSVGAGLLGGLLEKFKKGGKDGKQKKGKAMTEETVPESRPAAPESEPERMTEEIRTALESELAGARFFLERVLATKKPVLPNKGQKRNKTAEGMLKVIVRAGELKRSLVEIESELDSSEEADRVRGRVQDIVRRSESAVSELHKLKDNQEGWTNRFDRFMTSVRQLAVEQEVGELDEAALAKARPLVAKLAELPTDPPDLDDQIELILLEATS